MLGYRIFILCLKQLCVNWKIAFRLGWFWALIIVVVYQGSSSVLGAQFPNMAIDSGEHTISAAGFQLFFTIWLGNILVAITSATSVAIGWHRYILRGEIPSNLYFFPARKTFWPYIWRGIKIGLILLAVMIPLGFVLSAIGLSIGHSILQGTAMDSKGPFPVSLFVLSISGNVLLGSLVFWFFMRMGLGLPGIAVGYDVRSREAWRITEAFSGPLLTTAFLIALLQAIPSVLIILLGLILPAQQGDIAATMLPGSALFRDLLSSFIFLVFSIVSFFVGFGVLTVIYGHLEEGKPI